jgi:hypothetical protein
MSFFEYENMSIVAHSHIHTPMIEKQQKTDHDAELMDLPRHLVSNVLHSLDLQTSAPMRKVCTMFKNGMPEHPCLDKYALAWSTQTFPVAEEDEETDSHLQSLFYDSCKFSSSDYEGLTRCGQTDYLFADDLWWHVILDNNVDAAMVLLEKEPSCYSIPLCALVCAKSSTMLHFIENRTSLNLKHDALEMYLHHKNNHSISNDKGLLFLQILVGAGASLQAMAKKIVSNVDTILALLAGLETDLERHPLIKEINSPGVMLGLCCRVCITNLQLLGIWVFHSLIEQCNPEYESRIIGFLQEHFDGDFDDRNELDGEGRTVLQVLYTKRPLNRNILKVFNDWKHDDIEFYE